MVSVTALVEGDTERDFVHQVLQPALASAGVRIHAQLLGKRGGIKPWPVAQREIIYTLRKPNTVCTTMVDFYRLPLDWPGRKDAAVLPHAQRSQAVEQAVTVRLREELGEHFDSRRFIPYVQLHEFEALCFSDISALSSVLASLARPQVADRLPELLQGIIDQAGDPESIDDGYETCPSRRIAKLARYDKRAHGTIITKRIGLPTLRRQCSHFNRWLTRLEQLGTVGSA